MTINIVKTKVLYHIDFIEAKKHLNIEDDFHDDDTYINQLIEDATQEAENYIESDIAKTTNVLKVYDFYDDNIVVDEMPLISIDTISYLDSSGTPVSVTVGDCTIKKGAQKFTIVFPDFIDTDELTINFTSGYVARANCPLPILRAIKMRIADLYDVQRGSLISSAFKESGGFERALNPYKKMLF